MFSEQNFEILGNSRFQFVVSKLRSILVANFALSFHIGISKFQMQLIFYNNLKLSLSQHKLNKILVPAQTDVLKSVKLYFKKINLKTLEKIKRLIVQLEQLSLV